MPNPHYNYYPPAAAVVDQNEPRAYWNGRTWLLNGKTYTVPVGHSLAGRAGGPLSGWYYAWGQRAWMEPDRQITPRPAFVPTAPPPMQYPLPAPKPEKEKCAVKEKSPNVLEYLVKHPVAPLAGAIALLGSMLTDEPPPPQIPDNLPEATAKQWQMVYAQNLQRYQRRMSLLENIGTVLLGYTDASAILAALPAKRAS